MPGFVSVKKWKSLKVKKFCWIYSIKPFSLLNFSIFELFQTTKPGRDCCSLTSQIIAILSIAT
jgi:hypothetical protein